MLVGDFFIQLITVMLAVMSATALIACPLFLWAIQRQLKALHYSQTEDMARLVISVRALRPKPVPAIPIDDPMRTRLRRAQRGD